MRKEKKHSGFPLEAPPLKNPSDKYHHVMIRFFSGKGNDYFRLFPCPRFGLLRGAKSKTVLYFLSSMSAASNFSPLLLAPTFDDRGSAFGQQLGKLSVRKLLAGDGAPDCKAAVGVLAFGDFRIENRLLAAPRTDGSIAESRELSVWMGLGLVCLRSASQPLTGRRSFLSSAGNAAVVSSGRSSGSRRTLRQPPSLTTVPLATNSIPPHSSRAVDTSLMQALPKASTIRQAIRS